MQKLFKNKKVLVMGLGLNGGGVGVAKFFYKQGAKVKVTDLKPAEKLEESLKKLKGLKMDYALGGHKEEDFLGAELIIKNPDVPNSSPYLEIARKNNVPVETDASLFFKLSQAFTIGVTGTKGKSTTASLIYHLLKPKFKKVFLAGNIGVSPLEILPKVKAGQKVVLELSSFELDDLECSPNISVITNILPDHLNRYGNMQNYIESKKRIFKFQKPEDVLVLNADDEVVKSFSKEVVSKVLFFSAKENKPEENLKNFKLLGEHNVSNALAAITVAQILGVDEKGIQKALKTFKGVAHRQELIKEIKGVKYFNDTAATMPNAVIAAIDSFYGNFPGSKLVLIAGGQDKGLDYEEMSKAIKGKISKLVLLPGTASEKIKGYLSGWPNILEAGSMEEAVKKSSELAQKGDVVFLSPGAASFNLFKNEFDRGNQFVSLVKKIK